MKKIFLVLLICFITLTGYGQSIFNRGVQVGTNTAAAVVDSIDKYGAIFKMFSGATRLTESDVINDTIEARIGAALVLGDYAWLKTDTVSGQAEQIVTQTQLASFEG